MIKTRVEFDQTKQTFAYLAAIGKKGLMEIMKKSKMRMDANFISKIDLYSEFSYFF